MKTFLTIALIAATPAIAQTTPAPTSTPGTPAASANATSAGTTAATGKFNLDTPIETIAADPAGKAVLDKDLPGLTTHAMYDSFKAMSLKALQPLSNGALTDDQLIKVAADLATIK